MKHKRIAILFGISIISLTACGTTSQNATDTNNESIISTETEESSEITDLLIENNEQISQDEQQAPILKNEDGSYSLSAQLRSKLETFSYFEGANASEIDREIQGVIDYYYIDLQKIGLTEDNICKVFLMVSETGCTPKTFGRADYVSRVPQAEQDQQKPSDTTADKNDNTNTDNGTLTDKDNSDNNDGGITYNPDWEDPNDETCGGEIVVEEIEEGSTEDDVDGLIYNADYEEPDDLYGDPDDVFGEDFVLEEDSTEDDVDGTIN